MINNLYDAVYKGDKAEVIKNLTLDPSLIDVQKVLLAKFIKCLSYSYY